MADAFYAHPCTYLLLFHILQKLTDKIDNLHETSATRRIRRTEDKYDDTDSHLIDLDNLMVGIEKLKMMKQKSKRQIADPLLVQSIFNPGRFIKQAARTKKGEPMSQIFTYHGSFTEPGKQSHF